MDRLYVDVKLFRIIVCVGALLRYIWTVTDISDKVWREEMRTLCQCLDLAQKIIGIYPRLSQK